MDECLNFYPVQHAGVYIPTSAPDEGFFFSIYGTLNPLKAELHPICHLQALLGAHHIFHVSGLRVKCIHDRTVLQGRRYVKN